MMNAFDGVCPECEDICKVELVEIDESVTMKGKEVSFTAFSYRCTKCREIFDTITTLDLNLKRAHVAYMEDIK